MNRHVNAIAGRLSLRPPQRRSLEILDRITEIAPPSRGTNIQATLDAIHAEFPSVTDFEREFISLCFALATGVGKTRLMGAFITYLHVAHGVNNYFILAPNLTIYNKLVTDFTPNTPKYVFKGVAEFATELPLIVTGDNYESGAGVRPDLQSEMGSPVHINIFNISKINSEVRGGRSPRIKRLAEYIGESYFDYLAGLPDLVLLMDESHRYRASAGVKAINELKPILGLELTATPFVESSKGATSFKNVIYDYPLGQAIADGFVKEPAVVTRQDFDAAGMSRQEIELLKLEDGVRLHETVKVELETYSRETRSPIVKPFLLAIARDTTHASQLQRLIQSDGFFEGRYKDKVIQVDSSQTGKAEEVMVARLLRVEHAEEPTEIVIHVNMLKEGWDVTNLYTIVPLRAANARILIEQSIGRGLRLPFGHRTGVTAVDRLNIIAHDKFQEIIDEANRPDSPIRVAEVVLSSEELERKTVTIISQPRLATKLGFRPDATASTQHTDTNDLEVFSTSDEQEAAQLAYEVILRLQNHPERLPGVTYLLDSEIQNGIVREVVGQLRPGELGLESTTSGPDLAAVVAKTADLVVAETINIPRILVVPKNEVRSGLTPFTIRSEDLNFQVPSEELLVHHLRTHQHDVVELGDGGYEEVRLENYIVDALVDFDDVAYDDHADLLYDLAGQVIRHLLSYLSEDDTRKVLRVHNQGIARIVHAQMQKHRWEETVDYEVKITKGFTELRKSAYTATAGGQRLNFRVSPADKSNMAKYLFGGFERCLYSEQKFHSDTERKLAIILDREALKWFRPAKGQFQISYKRVADNPEYQPDFVAETADSIYMLEPKAANQLNDGEVLAKRDAAVEWCKHATDHAMSWGGKPWKYILIPHDAIADNMTLEALGERFICTP